MEVKEYGKTLNLPKTDFPMRGNLPNNEPKILEEVFEQGLYKKIIEKNKDKKTFVLHDGPPYANGPIHIGHALNKVLKDTIVRYKNMKGFKAEFIPGYDTHGLPTEIKAIEKLNLNREEIEVNKFRDTCKEFAEEYINLQTEGFKRLGVLGDWEDPYITYEARTEAEQLRVFAEMYKKGYIYKGLKPVYWCPHCETALAEAEIEYHDHKSMSCYVKFEVKDSKGLFDAKDTYLVIWTTTPWTLPGNMAITASPEFKYVLVSVEKEEKTEKYILLQETYQKLMEEWQIEKYSVVQEFREGELEGITYVHPFLDRVSKVILGSADTILVEKDSGTGLVHTAPGYGREDYLASLKNDIEIVVAVDEKGYQQEGAGRFKGLRYDKSNEAIVEYLQEKGYILATKKINHSYPHCWRCKNPIIYRAADQWFASIDGFRKAALDAIKNVTWYPAWGEERIRLMVAERNDWCISRQRTWGVPLPIFYCKDCKKEYVTEESLDKVIEIVRKEGTNAWYGKTEKELMPENAKCTCGCTEFVKETDIMDVWFDSGSTHHSVAKERGLGEIDLYLEGNDQYRGWFQSSLLTSVAMNGKAPYKEVVTNGFLVDEKGRKMSKSLGNVIAPQKIIKQYGADILRLWVISSDYQSDVSISDNILRQVSETYRKIRNTARYILGNISDFNPNTDKVEYAKLEEIDKWAIGRVNELVRKVTESYDVYAFSKAYHAINQFIVVDMSTFYLDIIKDRLYTEGQKSELRRSAQTAMYEILYRLVRILAPITSYTAEEIFKYMPKTEKEQDFSIMLEDYPKYEEKLFDAKLEEKFKKLIELKELSDKALEEARTEKVIGQSLEANILIKAPKMDYDFIKENIKLVKDVTITSGVDVELSNEEQISVTVKKAKGTKCQRCWMYDESTTSTEEYPEVCPRCLKVLTDNN
ncbi:MAG: isoleucine--tRNA ligase [Clostridium sp.]